MPSFRQPPQHLIIITLTGEKRYIFKMEARARQSLFGILEQLPDIKRTQQGSLWCVREEPCGYGPPLYISTGLFPKVYNLMESLCVVRSGAAPVRVEFAA